MLEVQSPVPAPSWETRVSWLLREVTLLVTFILVFPVLAVVFIGGLFTYVVGKWSFNLLVLVTLSVIKALASAADSVGAPMDMETALGNFVKVREKIQRSRLAQVPSIIGGIYVPPT